MTQTEPRHFQKSVAIKETDEDERTATGAALVPHEVDRQRDYFTPEAIEAFYTPDPAHGVMHYKFDEDDAEFTRSEVIDEPEEIGGQQYAAGAWIITKRYDDDELWQLVKDGVISAFSIGGDVSEEVDVEPDDQPEELAFPAEVEPGPATEVRNGYTTEISDVDIPAVPNANHAVVKSLDKSLVEQASTEEEFVELMGPRGMNADDASRLWSHLQKTHKHDMSDDTDDPDADAPDLDDFGAHKSFDDVDDATLGQRLKELLFGSPEDGVDGEAPASIELVGLPSTSVSKALAVAKEGRTLSAENRETLMVAHDAVEAALASDMDFETNRFTDSDEYSFDVAEYGKGDYEDKGGDKVAKLTEEQGDLVATAIQRFIDAQGDAPLDQFRDWLWSTDSLDDDTMFAAEEAVWQYEAAQREQMEQTPVSEGLVPWAMDEADTDTEITMTDTDTDADVDKSADDPLADAPEWAKALHEQAEKNAARLDEIEGDDADDIDKAIEDAPEWAKALHDQAEQNAERIDAVAQGTAKSDQVEPAAETEDEPADGLDKVAGLLG